MIFCVLIFDLRDKLADAENNGEECVSTRIIYLTDNNTCNDMACPGDGRNIGVVICPGDRISNNYSQKLAEITHNNTHRREGSLL